jgi:hypothetical protein
MNGKWGKGYFQFALIKTYPEYLITSALHMKFWMIHLGSRIVYVSYQMDWGIKSLIKIDGEP